MVQSEDIKINEVKDEGEDMSTILVEQSSNKEKELLTKQLKEIICKNKRLIEKTTPFSPTIKKDDEWYNEDDWEKF